MAKNTKAKAEKAPKAPKKTKKEIAAEKEQALIGKDNALAGKAKADLDEEIAGTKESDLKKADSVDVLRGSDMSATVKNIYIRTYSGAIHGEDFLDLAHQFQAKHPSCVLVPSDTIVTLSVLYREKEDAEKSLKDQNPDAPMVDKRRDFEDKDEALAFNQAKKGTIVVKR